jgi:hypothetical protein
MSVDFIIRRSFLKGTAWLAGIFAHLPGEGLLALDMDKKDGSEGKRTIAMADDGLEWEKLIEGLRPLGDAMRTRVPQRLRNDPQIMAESMRLLLAGMARASSDAMVGDRRHPMFVPELNIAQNIFQPNADTIYKSCLIEKGGVYMLRGDRGSVRMIILAQMGPDTLRTGKHHPLLAQIDFDDLTAGEDGSFEMVISPERPASYDGDWFALHPQCEKLMMWTRQKAGPPPSN